MIYTAYLDESDTHGNSPTIIMTGVLGSEHQWTEFNRTLQSIREKHGFNIIHAKDLKNKRGEFRGWSTERCLALVKDLTEACDHHLSNGCTISIPHSLYRKEYRDTPFPKGMPIDSHYGLCFRKCLAQLGYEVRSQNNQAVLNIVLEAGHANAGDAERIFNEFKTVLTEARLNNFGSFTTAKKHETLPLMVADFFAHAHSIINKKGWDLARFNVPEFRGDKHVINLQVTSSELHQLKQNFQARKEARMKEWKNRRTKADDCM